jgi:hypothetical protein
MIAAYPDDMQEAYYVQSDDLNDQTRENLTSYSANYVSWETGHVGCAVKKVVGLDLIC